MQFDRDRFYASYRIAFPSRLSQSQVDGLNTLLSSIETDTHLTDIRHAAYMLATVKHECADTWQPIIERGARSYFDKYEAGTAIGKRLGNKLTGDGYRYRGRGYVQITGRANYMRMTDKINVEMLDSDNISDRNAADHIIDLIADPDQALRPSIAYEIMWVGMRRGLFTGKKLSDYINDSECDYVNARRIINGLDRALLVASYAQDIEKVLRTSITDEC